MHMNAEAAPGRPSPPDQTAPGASTERPQCQAFPPHAPPGRAPRHRARTFRSRRPSRGRLLRLAVTGPQSRIGLSAVLKSRSFARIPEISHPIRDFLAAVCASPRPSLPERHLVARIAWRGSAVQAGSLPACATPAGFRSEIYAPNTSRIAAESTFTTSGIRFQISGSPTPHPHVGKQLASRPHASADPGRQRTPATRVSPPWVQMLSDSASRYDSLRPSARRRRRDARSIARLLLLRFPFPADASLRNAECRRVRVFAVEFGAGSRASVRVRGSGVRLRMSGVRIRVRGREEGALLVVGVRCPAATLNLGAGVRTHHVRA